MATVTQGVIDANAGVKSKQLRWAIFKVEGSEIVVDQTGERDSDIEALRSAIHTENSNCRYAIYDFEAKRADGASMSKICFISYAPDSCTSMPEKMGFMDYKQAVLAKVDSRKDFQINDLGDLTEENFAEAFGL